MNNIGLTNKFSDVNATFPSVGRAGMIMGQFSSVSDGYGSNPTIDRNSELEVAPV